MRFKSLILIFLTFVFFIPTAYLKAEDSELKEFTNSQGNVYRVDKQNKIYTDGLPHSERQPATVENLPYYFNQSMVLEANGYLEEAIKMYYEILCLPKVNQSVVLARRAIIPRIKRFYNEANTKNFVMKYFSINKLGEGNLVQYINKKYLFAFKYPSSWKISKEIIEDKQRNAAFISLVAPASLDNEGNVVDISLGLMVERLPGNIQSSEYAAMLYKRMQNYTRTDTKVLDSGGIKNKFITSFRGSYYYGEEVFWAKNGIGYYLAFNAGPSSLYELTKDYFYQILNTIELQE